MPNGCLNISSTSFVNLSKLKEVISTCSYFFLSPLSQVLDILEAFYGVLPLNFGRIEEGRGLEGEEMRHDKTQDISCMTIGVENLKVGMSW